MSCRHLSVGSKVKSAIDVENDASSGTLTPAGAQTVATHSALPREPDLSPRKAAELSGISYWTVLREIERGRLRAYRRAGNKLAIRRDDYCAWAYGHPVEPKAPMELDAVAPRPPRTRPVRGSVSALLDLERQKGVA